MKPPEQQQNPVRGERMPFARAAHARFACVTLTACICVCSAAARADSLEAYRIFTRTLAAAQLLTEARASMRAHFEGTPDPVVAPSDSTAAWPGPPAGVYVTLVDGRKTRACIGSVSPLGSSLRETVQALAVRVLDADRRRDPVRREELDHLRLVLAFTGDPVPVSDPMQVHLARQGLLVNGSAGNVAFLPGEARTVAYALREARRIGVIADAGSASFQRFEVVTLAEPGPPHPSAAPLTPGDAR